jgi:hypothetical protein
MYRRSAQGSCFTLPRSPPRIKPHGKPAPSTRLPWGFFDFLDGFFGETRRELSIYLSRTWRNWQTRRPWRSVGNLSVRDHAPPSASRSSVKTLTFSSLFR